jgi:serine/threonine protein phosphatase PrpC
MRARGWAITDVGLRRNHNEDSILCNDRLALYAVADGMGGHQGGDRASRMAVDVLEQEVEKEASLRAAGPEQVARALGAIAGKAAQSIHDVAQQEPRLAGMGTTLTALMIQEGHATICHVGDSRAYLYRDGRARQLTEDHSWIQEQIRAGLLSPQDALASRFRNIITRSVGFERTVQPDLLTLAVEPGDCFLVCSDGLSNYLSTEELGRALSAHFYGEAPQALVDLANDRGGDDNISCVVVYLANDAVPAAR